MGPTLSKDYNSHKLKEEEIIRRILQGEKELYEILVKRNNQKLYRVIRSYLNNEAEVEDVMQNSYLKAYLNLNRFKRASTFSTWLIRIGINEALMRLKGKKRLHIVQESFGSEPKNKHPEMPDHKQKNPHDRLVHQETRKLLENAIDQLDVKYKTVYILKEVEEMSLKEVASILDISVSNVKVRLHRSKEMLKELLFEMSLDYNIFEFGFSRCDRVTENVMKQISRV